MVATWRRQVLTLRSLRKAEARGDELIAVPAELAAEVRSFIWTRKVAIANARWSSRRAPDAKPPWEWAAAKYGPICPECSRPFCSVSPDCPHRVTNVHPLWAPAGGWRAR